MLSPVFDAFVEASPVSVMMRVLMENIFNSSRMNKLFENSSVRQYEQELLFSTQVDLMSLVVCKMYSSVHAAYQKKAVEISVSVTALYNKLQRGRQNRWRTIRFFTWWMIFMVSIEA